MTGISALLVGVASPRPHTPPLRGVDADLDGWRTRLVRMGVPQDRIERIGPAGTTRGQVLAALDALAQRVAASPEGQGLLVLAGHGGATTGGLLACADGDLRTEQVRERLDAYLPGRGITAFVDLCATAGEEPDPCALRACDLVLAAASPGQVAEELAVEGQWQGAFTWAVHRVLDRWAGLGPHGALVPISPQVLHRQASLLLQGLGFAQRPTLVGPEARRIAPLAGDSVLVTAPLPAQVTRQISPETDSMVYKIQTLQGADLGRLVVTGSSFQPTGDYVASREYWEVLPTSAFKLVPTTESLPGTAPNKVYTQFAFDPSGGTSSYTLSAGTGQTLFKLTVGTDEVGYLMRTAGTPVGLAWYMTTDPITAYFPTPSGGLAFGPVTGSVTIDAQRKIST